MKYPLSLLLLMTAYLGLSQECEEVQTGTFFINDQPYGSSKLIRTETSQEEIVEKLGIHSKYDLLWIDDCKYALFNAVSIKRNPSIPSMGKTDTLYIEILRVTKKGYEFKASSNFSDFETVGFADVKE